jgi:uncharacterized protein
VKKSVGAGLQTRPRDGLKAVPYIDYSNGFIPEDVIQSIREGVVINVRVIPRAGKAGVAGTRGDAWLVRLHAPPVEGAANAELIALLAATLGVPKRAISIVAGEGSRQKRIHVIGIDAATAEARLSAPRDAPRAR